MPSDVSASKIQDNIKFSTEFRTKYNPIVTAAATTRLKTNWEQRSDVIIEWDQYIDHCRWNLTILVMCTHRFKFTWVEVFIYSR